MKLLWRLPQENGLRKLPNLASFPPSSRSLITRPLSTSKLLLRSRHLSTRLPTRRPYPTKSSLLVRNGPRRLYTTNKPPIPTQPGPGAEPANLSLSQRLRKLSREYGWSALGVYLALSAFDFPFCFMAVRYLGTDRIGHWEHVIVDAVKGFTKWPLGQGAEERKEVEQEAMEMATGKEDAYAKIEGGADGMTRERVGEVTEEWTDHGYKEAEKANKGEGASIWTQLALAYAIHKSFIFIRVPLTAAVTPKVVRILRGWGWDIGKRRPKGVKGPPES